MEAKLSPWVLAVLLLLSGFPGADAAGGKGKASASIGTPHADSWWTVGEAVPFLAELRSSGSCTVRDARWDFGDGASARGVETSHAFAAAGTYTVVLTPEHDCRHADSASVTLHVRDAALRVTLLADDPTPTAGSALTLVAHTEGGTGAKTYAFGFDGLPVGNGTEDRLVLRPTAAGEHIASVRVEDAAGAIADATLIVRVGPAALASLVVTGPREMTVGTDATFVFEGFDAYGNTVALSEASRTVEAPLAAGPFEVTASEADVTGRLLVQAVPDALAAISVTGPDEVRVRTEASYRFSGSDRHGNVVPLARTDTTLVAPARTGTATVCHEEQGIQGCKDVRFVPGPLARLHLTGPAEVRAGEEAAFDVRGEDADGNEVRPALERIVLRMPTLAGPTRACHTEDDITGCADVRVAPGPLETLWLTGPARVVAGEPATFTATGHDAHGNPVPVANATFVRDAPTRAGPWSVEKEEQGVVGRLDVVVEAGAPARLWLVGPDKVPAATRAEYEVRAADKYGNPTAAATPRLGLDAPTKAGPLRLVHEEGEARAEKDVLVVPGAPARLEVRPDRAVVNVGQTIHLATEAWDAHGNPVDTRGVSWSPLNGRVHGDHYINHAEGRDFVAARLGEIQAQAVFDIVKELRVVVETTKAAYAPGEAATGEVEVRALVRHQDGSPVRDALVVLHFERVGDGPATPPARLEGRTGADGMLHFRAPPTARLPGEYHLGVQAGASGSSGEAATLYVVGLG